MYDKGAMGLLLQKSRVFIERKEERSREPELTLQEEIRQASLEVEMRRVAWDLADQVYEEAAWHAFRSATERLNALLKQAREVVGA
ncbi:MAG: hypothetical protein OWT28_08275 [Firmicutes bacterium]|nr:hypothetical protein [Bacillota bacterium]